MQIEITNSAIEAILCSHNSNIIIRDTILTGYGVRVYSSGKASYFIEPTINGKSKRKVIGKYPQLSTSQARALAEERIRDLTTTVQTRTPAPTYPTLQTAYKNYINQIQLKPSSIAMYDVVVK